MTISKLCVQKHISCDCEARYWDWVDTDELFDDLTEKLKDKWDGWFDGVRVVEKTFNAETFTITIKPIESFKRESVWDENGRKWYTKYNYYTHAEEN